MQDAELSDGFIYYYYPGLGYFYPAPGYFDPPGYRYPVLRYSVGRPMVYAPAPRYSFPAPWYTGGYSSTPWYGSPYRPGWGTGYRGGDRRPYPY
jgi:hypothetical protein